MATLYNGDNDTYSKFKPKSTIFEPPDTAMSPTSSSSDIALTSVYPPKEFKTAKNFKTAVLAQVAKLDRGDNDDQYVSFCSITPKEFERIEARRLDFGRGVKFSYFLDIESLIVKLPTKAHELAHNSFGTMLAVSKVGPMGIHYSEFMGLGATKYVGQNVSSKDGDSSWINMSIRPKDAWPNFVIEAGMSQGILRLRAAVRWWIEHSQGHVGIVLLIHIIPISKTIQLEKWIPSPSPSTRVSPRLNAVAFPMQTAEISIIQSRTPPVNGAPLVLEIERVFGRQPQGSEADISLSAQELDSWAKIVLRGI